MTANPTTNAIVRPPDTAVATKATNRTLSTMLIRARAPAGPACRAMSFLTTAQAMATSSVAARRRRS
jgi:hypothetical protein